MKYIVFDVETTGLNKADEVIQFSAIVMNESFKSERAINFYCETQAPISAEAYNVHHLSKEKLHTLSEQMVFEDNWLKLIESLHGEQIVWIDWSVGGFDERIVNQTLTNNGLEDYFHFQRFANIGECKKNFLSTFDLMKVVSNKMGKARMKLGDAAKTLPYSKSQIDFAYDKLANQFNNIDESMRYHNSLYDTFVTWLLFKYHLGV